MTVAAGASPLKTTSANNKFSAPNKKKLVPGQRVGNRVERVAMRDSRFKWMMAKVLGDEGRTGRQSGPVRLWDVCFFIYTPNHSYIYIFIHVFLFFYIAGSVLGSHATVCAD